VDNSSAFRPFLSRCAATLAAVFLIGTFGSRKSERRSSSAQGDAQNALGSGEFLERGKQWTERGPIRLMNAVLEGRGEELSPSLNKCRTSSMEFCTFTTASAREYCDGSTRRASSVARLPVEPQPGAATSLSA